MILYVTTQVFFVVSLMLCMMSKTTLGITPLDESNPKSDFQFWTFLVFTGILIKYAV